MQNLGKILKHIRVFNGLSQGEIENKFNISHPYASRIETGKVMPTMEVLEKYSSEFKIPLSAIMIFAENYEEKVGFKNAMKKGLTGTALKFLDWIVKE